MIENRTSLTASPTLSTELRLETVSVPFICIHHAIETMQRDAFVFGPEAVAYPLA